MQTSDVLDVIGFIRSDFVDFSREFYRANVLSIILTLPNCRVGFTKDEVSSQFIRKLGSQIFSHVVVTDALDELFREDIIGMKLDKYVLRKNIDVLDHSTSRIFSEFEPFLKSNIKEYDPFLNKNYRPAFELLFNEFIELLASSTELNAHIIENVHAEENVLRLEESVSSILTPLDGKKFVRLFLDYTMSGSKIISDIIFEIIQTIVAVDLLEKGKEVARFSGNFGSGRYLILDTNIIVASLCPSNPRCDLTISALKFAKDLGFDIVYTNYTMREYENLVANADYLMASNNLSLALKDNELVTDYLSSSRKIKWHQRKAELDSYGELIKELYGARPVSIGKEISVKKDDDDRLRATFEVFSRQIGRTRSDDAISHDIALIVYAGSQRKKMTDQKFPNPLIITLDNTFINVDSLDQKIAKAEFGHVMHVRMFLSGILPFWNRDIRDIKKELLVAGFVKNLTVPIRTGLTVENYSKLIAEKLDLKVKDADILLKILITSPLKDELARGLREKDSSLVSATTIQLLQDTKVVEEILAREQSEKQIEELRNKLSIMREQLQAVTAVNKVLTEIPRISNVVTLTQEVNPEVIKQIEELIQMLVKQYPDVLKESNVDVSDLQTKNPGKIRSLCSKLENWINRNGTLISNSQSIISALTYLGTLLGKA